MNKRVLFKTFELDGRKWRIGKFNAMVGSYIAYKLMAEVMPLGIAQQAGIPVPAGGKSMSKADFIELQKDCLSCCYEFLPAGPAPVINENGTFGVEDLENNVKVVMALTIQALIFNVSDFFTENLLSSLADSMKTLIPPVAKI